MTDTTKSLMLLSNLQQAFTGTILSNPINKVVATCSSQDLETCHKVITDSAIEMGSTAQSAARNNGVDNYILATCGLGKYYVTSYNDKDYKQALTNLDKGIELAQQLAFSRSLAICYNYSAERYINMGIDEDVDGTPLPIQNYIEGIHSYEQAYPIFSHLDDKPWLGLVAIHVAEVYPYTSTNVFTEQTRIYFNTAYNIADTFEDEWLLGQVTKGGIGLIGTYKEQRIMDNIGPEVANEEVNYYSNKVETILKKIENIKLQYLSDFCEQRPESEMCPK